MNDRFRSARWANIKDIHRAGLFSDRGLFLGFANGRPLFADGDAPILTLGGSGSGKLATILAYTACTSALKTAWLDPKGEIAAISYQNQARMGKAAWLFNPHRKHGLHTDTVNPTGHIRKGSISVTSEIKVLAEDLIPLSGGGNAQFFEDAARDYLEVFCTYDVEKLGALSLKRVRGYLMIMISNDDQWRELAGDMAFHAPSVMGTLKELLGTQRDTPKTFSGISKQLTNALSWMSDPAVLECLSETPTLDLEEFVASQQAANLYFMVPADMLGVWSPLLRIIFAALVTIKDRNPHSPRLHIIVDEAGQLGHASFLKRLFSYARGAGARGWAIFQDLGQISSAFGREGLQTFVGSAETRQIIGTRDIDTARMVSDMLGVQTVSYSDPHRLAAAEDAKRRALQDFMEGGDPMHSLMDAAHHRKMAHIPDAFDKPLLDPAEVLNMSGSDQVIFTSAKDCPPILAQRAPYWTQSAMAGQFMPNPYHPPLDQVQIATRWGMRSHRVIEEQVPARLAHLPQYQDRPFRYVDGFRPNVGR